MCPARTVVLEKVLAQQAVDQALAQRFRYRTRMNPYRIPTAVAVSLRASHTNRLEHFTNVPPDERWQAPLLKSPSQWPRIN